MLKSTKDSRLDPTSNTESWWALDGYIMGIRCASGEKPCGSFQKVVRGAAGAGSPGENVLESGRPGRLTRCFPVARELPVSGPAQPTGLHTGWHSTAHRCAHWLPRHILFLPACILAFSRDVDDDFCLSANTGALFNLPCFWKRWLNFSWNSLSCLLPPHETMFLSLPVFLVNSFQD